MSEIKITVYENSKDDHDLLLQHIKHAGQELNLNLQIAVAEPYLWLTIRGRIMKLYYSECRYIETEKRRLVFHYKDQMIYKSDRISKIIDQLPPNIFFRCNNSYIVNLDHISEIVPEGGRYNIFLSTGEVIPLSRSRYRECLKLLQIER